MALAIRRREDGVDRLAEAARCCGFFGRLKPEAIDALVRSATLMRLPAGARNIPVPLSVVLSGLVAYVLMYRDGRQITVRYISPGGLAGSLSQNPLPLASAVHALEPSVLLQLDLDTLTNLARHDFDVSLALIEELSARLLTTYDTLATRSFGTVRARVARDLLARAQVSGCLHDGVRVSVTRQALADSTGSVREVVSRSLRELRRRGTISSERGRITILDVHGLTRQADLIDTTA
jgi:CRP/FNR family transcriptional regulator, cyclic AMP receptor protein